MGIRNSLENITHGITSDRGLGKGSPPDVHSLTNNTSLGQRPRFSTARAVVLGNRMDDRISVC